MSFRFKQFTLNDDKCAMKIGTDACLLGSWADIENARNILDIGTGSGIIALMLAQRSKALIDAVEIDDDSYTQANKNFSNSPWKERLNVFPASFQEYVKTCLKKYDVIVCNPPYFQNSLKPHDRKRKLARHNDSLSYEELINASSKLLNENGKLYLIIPSDTNSLINNIGLVEGFYITGILHVKAKNEDSFPFRNVLLMEKTYTKCVVQTIAIHDNKGKSYTHEYIQLTKDFYINF